MGETESVEIISAREKALELLMRDYALLKDTIDAIEVNNNDTFKNAGDFRAKVDKFIKTIEITRKEHVDPLNKLVKTINGEFKPVAVLFEGLLSKLDNKMIPYQREVQRKKEEWAKQQREKELAEMEAKSKAIEAVAYETDSEELLDMASGIAKEGERIASRDIVVKKTIAGNEAKTTLRKTWDIKITDEASVPREYCIPDERKLKEVLLKDNKDAAIKGEFKIAGVEVFFTETLVSSKSL